MRCDLLRKQIDFKMISRISEQGDVTMIKKAQKVLRGGDSYHRKYKKKK